MKTIKLLLVLLAVSVLSYSQQFKDLSPNVPFDTTFVKGVLPNGLTYYIKHNNSPKGRASFYLIQNVGASLETDEQDGLAHFLEHMAFNGTKTFPGKAMLNMLEKRGVKFGKDINAYTTRNETVYNLSRVPVNEPALVDSCLMVLHDWCDDLSLEPSEIDAERGVISEEWRTRHDAGFRIREKTAPVLFNNAIYAQRDVIGDLNVIKNFKYDVLRSFYHDWYRTDLQAIAIVGDIDVKTIEKKVIEIFSKIPAVENPKKRTVTVIPDNEKPMYVLATDNEYKYVTTEYKTRFAETYDNTLSGRKNRYLNNMFNALTKARLSEALKKGDAPFLNAYIGTGGIERGYKSFSVSASSYTGKEAQAFEAVYTELQRIINFGFTATELERLKVNMLTMEESRYNKRKSVDSDDICKLLKTTYLEHSSIPDAEFTYKFAKEIIPGITVAEVSSLASKYLSDKNVNFIVTGPESNPTKYITQPEIEAIIKKVKSAKLTPFVDDVPENSGLLSSQPTPGAILVEKDVDSLKAQLWTLSNGAKVVYKYVKGANSPIMLKAISPGGNSIYDRDDLPTVDAISGMVSGFGLGEFDQTQLKKMLAGNSAQSEFKIGQLNESVSGSALQKDLETMFQLVYMRFEEPRFDEEKYENLIKRFYYNLENTPKNSQNIINDTIKSILNAGNPRYEKMDKQYLDKVDFEKMKSIYNARFSNASDFVFYIVGDVQPEVLKPLVEKYIASIPSSEYPEKWKNNGDYFPKGKNNYKISIPLEENKATVLIKMKTDEKYSRKSVVYNNIISSILSLRYIEEIREKEGGTYGVSVKPSYSRIPESQLGMEIKFDCDPDKAEHLKSLVYKEIEKIQKKVSQVDLDKVVLNLKKNFQQVPKNNSYWMTVLTNYFEFGENMTLASNYTDILDKVTVKDIQKASKAFFKKADLLDMVFVPEKK